MRLKNKKTGQEGNFIINKDHFECVDLDCVPLYFSLSELLEEWGDCTPKEPLIKDEKIRKAVRAWAEACCIELIEITHSRKSILRAMDAITGNDEICINREIGQILDEKVYNIEELCGEEKE